MLWLFDHMSYLACDMQTQTITLWCRFVSCYNGSVAIGWQWAGRGYIFATESFYCNAISIRVYILTETTCNARRINSFNEIELFPLRLFHEKWKPLHTCMYMYMTTCTCTYMYIEFEVNQLWTSPHTCVPVCNCNTKTQHGFTLDVDTGVRFQPGSIEVCLPRTHVGLWCRCCAPASDDFQDLPALCAANLRNKYK